MDQSNRQQIKQVERVKTERKKDLKTFEDVVLSFGFKKCGIRQVDVKCYSNDEKGWYAEIIPEYNSHYAWVTGKGLIDDNMFPGGHIYHSTEELIKELSKHYYP